MCKADKLEELKADPTAASQEDFAFWIATFDPMGEEEDRAFGESGRQRVNALNELSPKV